MTTAAYSEQKKMAARRFGLARGLIVLTGLLALVAALVSTRLGPGVGGDATIYITTARNFVAGQGFGLIDARGEFRLLPYFAPFFPLALSLFEALRIDLPQAARWLNALLFAGLACGAGLATLRLTRSALWGLLAALLIAFSPILLPVYSWAMSEPLALLLGFGGLWLALVAGRDERRGAAFYGSAALTGLSFFTRYSSAGFAGAALLGLLLFRPGPLRRRLLDVLLYGVLAALPTALWMGYIYAQTQAVSSRSIESAAGMAGRFAAFWPQAANMLLAWLIPYSWMETPRYPALINRLLPLAAVLGLTGWSGLTLAAARRLPARWDDERLRSITLLLLLVLAYLAVILVVYVTTYPPITIDNRMLSPLHVSALLLLPLLAAVTVRRFSAQRWIRLVLLAALALGAAWFGWRTLRIVLINAEQGVGYSALEWRESQTRAALRAAVPPGMVIITNEQNALQYLDAITPYPLMEPYQAAPSAVFTRYGEGDLSSDDAQRMFRQHKAVLVLFDTIYPQMESLYGARTNERVQVLTGGLEVLFHGDDGSIYAYPAE